MSAAEHPTETAVISRPTGTGLSSGGLRQDLPRTVLPPWLSTILALRILDADGEPVLDYDLEQGKELHLVVVSRDLTRHAHLHPERSADGTTSAWPSGRAPTWRSRPAT